MRRPVSTTVEIGIRVQWSVITKPIKGSKKWKKEVKESEIKEKLNSIFILLLMSLFKTRDVFETAFGYKKWTLRYPSIVPDTRMLKSVHSVMGRRPRTNITYIQHNQHDVLGTYSAQERVIRVIIYLRKPEKKSEKFIQLTVDKKYHHVTFYKSFSF